MQPLISILVPVFNGAACLAKCLDSILSQTYQPLEVVLVNDGSTDGTAKICEAYAAKDARIRYFEQQNQGLAATRNILLRAAQGELVSFVDADDYVEPTYLSYLWTLMQASQCGVSACNHWICRGLRMRPRFSAEDSQVTLTPQEAFANILYDLYPDVSACAKLYKKDIFEKVVYPSGRLFEDTFCIAEILLAGDGLIYGGKPQYHYQIHADSLSRGRFSRHKLDYVAAVDHMTEIMRAHCNGMEAGMNRRKMHALLSTRRYLVGCSLDEVEIRDRLEAQIRVGAAHILRDRHSPVRDKIGVLSVMMGTKVYDALWTAYERIRK